MSINVDFSLALNDRTGKLFLGKDIISSLGGRVTRVHYGRLHEFPHNDLMRRIAGRLTHKETIARVHRSRLVSWLPAIRDPRPTLHLDPLSVVRHRLEARDIVLCHDVGPITHPQYFAAGVDDLYLQAYDQIRRMKPHMVFVSKTSQSEFHKLYGYDYASSNVIYIPTRLGIKEGEGHPVDGISCRFLLTVGSIGDRKNQARCIEAFAASGLADEGWQYVIAGGPEPGAVAVVELARRTPGVVLPGYTTDDALRWLYRNASGFVLMSLLEGFGMPVIEAIEHDLPCLVSGSSILTEVGGEAMLDADPLDLQAIASGMRSLADMSGEERIRRMSQARAHLRIFAREPILASWRELVERIG
ncbi:glycosyltransferase [Paraburkholderia lycopersici]|uniref:Glycosyltransferase involved in cell wall bisynthesis n=1 Tax=Paraburkholderia lycopersici TaxID=416944 RepID=A0A1G6GJT4_9BURK|nr:glycosyltransferase [Paraburkholderia lycopersici]SDB82261.1 Glycosyltransferase involved in cell wall bisynthesis [Paraburkholderia lycopersici]